MLKKDKISKNEAVSKVNEMIKKGFRLSVEVYSEFLRLMEVLWGLGAPFFRTVCETDWVDIFGLIFKFRKLEI